MLRNLGLNSIMCARTVVCTRDLLCSWKSGNFSEGYDGGIDVVKNAAFLYIRRLLACQVLSLLLLMHSLYGDSIIFGLMSLPCKVLGILR